MKRILPIILLLALFASAAQATTYYVRIDGGPSPTCNGTANAPASAAPACAWNNPQWTLPPGYAGDGVKATPLKSGDTVLIAAGSYAMGYGTPGASACQTQYAYACIFMGTIPAGVTIQGDCSAPPELWGNGHQSNLFNLTGSTGVTLRCLVLTDHGTCIDGTFAGIPSCGNSATDKSVQDGIDIRGAANVTLDRVNIHGLADYGILAGELTGTTTVSGVTLRANAMGGWSGDLGGNGTNSTNSGTLTFSNDLIAWNGCTEAYPDTTIVGCRGADQGGYGDGLGTALTGGDWRILNSTFSHNTSDGLDLLYADGTGSILVDHVIAAYNASQQIKVNGNATVQNSIVIGACDELAQYGLTSLCRAAGNAVELDFTAAGQSQTFQFNTVTGNGDCLIDNGPGSANSSYVPDASNAIAISNNIMLGQVSYLPKNSGGYTCAFYSNGTPKVTWTATFIWNTRNTDFTTPGMIHADPLLKDESLPTFDPTLLPNSPAIGANSGARPEIQP